MLNKTQCRDSADDRAGICCETVPNIPWIAVRGGKVKFMHRRRVDYLDGRCQQGSRCLVQQQRQISAPNTSQSPRSFSGNLYIFDHVDVDADAHVDDEICDHRKHKVGGDCDQRCGFAIRNIKERCDEYERRDGCNHRTFRVPGSEYDQSAGDHI